MPNPRSVAKGVLAALIVVAGPALALGLIASPAEAANLFTVSSNADSGASTLRAAVTAANAATGDSEIDVNTGVGTIALLSALPVYTGGTGADGALTLKGNGVKITGPSSGDTFSISSTGAASFDALTISGGGSSGIDVNSGAVTLTNSTISGETDQAIDTGDGGAVTVTNSRLTGNGFNGIDTGSDNSITVTASTIDANGSNGIDAGDDVTVTVKNSTFNKNGNDAFDLGTGITLNLAYDTIDQNDADTDGGAQIEAGGGTITSFGTVITRPGANATDCETDATMTSQGYNFVDDNTCDFTMSTDKSSAFSPGLGALASNGGSTPTELPQTGSVLIDAIPTSACQTGLASGITADQRGISRPQGSGCDVGAVEVAVTTTTTTTPTTTTTTPTQIQGATTPHTGEPWAGSRPYSVTLGAAGVGLLALGLRRRYRSRTYG